jgi:hypothetical protein
MQYNRALDRTNISNRKAAYVLSAVAQTNYDSSEAEKLPLSVSSIRRARKQYRFQHALNTKDAFSSERSLVIYFDGKLIPNISGGPLKEDRVAILVSGDKIEKLLGVPKVEQGSGEKGAEVVLKAIDDWKLRDQIVGMSFDTTAANTGRKNGACVLIEQKLQKDLLWLACRHHIFEILCGNIFNELFGVTSGPNVKIFDRFRDFWPNID